MVPTPGYPSGGPVCVAGGIKVDEDGFPAPEDDILRFTSRWTAPGCGAPTGPGTAGRRSSGSPGGEVPAPQEEVQGIPLDKLLQHQVVLSLADRLQDLGQMEQVQPSRARYTSALPRNRRRINCRPVARWRTSSTVPRGLFFKRRIRSNCSSSAIETSHTRGTS